MIKIVQVKKLGSAEVIVDIIPKGNPEIRPGVAMEPEYITIHNTGNRGKNANALMHNTYIHNMSKYSPKDTSHVSWHFTVDDKRIYQHLPLNEHAWHCGDGAKGTGNRKSIGIEICENPETDTKQAEENAIALTVYLLKALSLPVANVKPHQVWSGKYCPRVILKRDGSFTPFHNRIKRAFDYVPPVAQVQSAAAYTVQSGDSLWGISKVFGISVTDLKSVNGLKSDTIFPGQVLKVSKPAAKPKQAPKSSGIKAVGKIKVDKVNNFTYIYADVSDKSKVLGKAYKNQAYSIAGSVPDWYEIIFQGNKRAYIKEKYASRV